MNDIDLGASTVDRIRSDLIDTAVRFLKNPKVTDESLEKKRTFLQKKGLTDHEIEYAFKLTEKKDLVIKHEKTSFLRRLFTDLVIAGLLSYAYRVIRRYFGRWNSNSKADQLKTTIENLQKTVQEIQTSVRQLEHTAEQLHLVNLSGQHSSVVIDELKREIQVIKELSLSRSRFPPPPSVPVQVPAWQLQEAEKLKASSSSINLDRVQDENKDSDGIIVINDPEKNSDDEGRSMSSPSLESANENELTQ